MKKILPAVVLLATGLVLGAGAIALFRPAPPVTVRATVSRHTAFVGDSIRYTLTLTAPEAITVAPPPFKKNLGAFTVRDISVSRRRHLARTVTAYHAVLTSYTTGTYTIPEMRLRYTKEGAGVWYEITAPAISVTIASVLPPAVAIRIGAGLAAGKGTPVAPTTAGTEHIVRQSTHDSIDIFDALALREPLTVTDIALRILTAAAAIVIAIIMLGFLGDLVRRLRRGRPVTPAERAIRQLREIRAMRRTAPAALKEAYAALARALKEYLRERFLLAPAEMTAREFLDAVSRINALSPQQKQAIAAYIALADIITFSPHEPPAADFDTHYAAIETVIRQLAQPE